MTIEESTEYYDQRTCCMYHRILNDRTRRDTVTATKHSFTSLPRRNKDSKQIEENNAMASTVIDQDTYMEGIFHLEL